MESLAINSSAASSKSVKIATTKSKHKDISNMNTKSKFHSSASSDLICSTNSKSSESTDAFTHKSKKKMKEKISQLKEVVEFIDDDEISSQQEPFSRSKLGDFSCISQSSCLATDSISYSLDNKSIADNLKLSVTQSDAYKTELEKSSILKQNSMITIIPYYSVIATYGTTSPKIVTKVLPGKSVKTCKRVVHKENLLKKFTLLDESVLDDDMCTDEMNKSDDKSFLPSLNSQKRVISKSPSYPLSNNSLFGSASKRMSGKMKLLNPTEVYEHSPRKKDVNIPKTLENVCFNHLHKGVELRLIQKSPKVSFTVLLGKATSLEK